MLWGKQKKCVCVCVCVCAYVCVYVYAILLINTIDYNDCAHAVCVGGKMQLFHTSGILECRQPVKACSANSVVLSNAWLVVESS